MTDEMTGADLLALTPEEALGDGLRSNADPTGLGHALRSDGCLALCHQAESDGTPPDAVGMCVAAVEQVRDRLTPGPIPAEARAELADRLAFQTEGCPALARWTTALLERVETHDDVAALSGFLTRTYELWHLRAAARARDARARDEAGDES